MKTRTWTFERAREWRREYKRKRWQEDPEYRRRHKEIARESAKRYRNRLKEFRALFYPFGFRLPAGYRTPHRVIQAFGDHLQQVFNVPVARAYLAFPFDPHRPDAPELFQQRTLRGAAELMDGADPVKNSNTPGAIIRYYNRP